MPVSSSWSQDDCSFYPGTGSRSSRQEGIRGLKFFRFTVLPYLGAKSFPEISAYLSLAELSHMATTSSKGACVWASLSGLCGTEWESKRGWNRCRLRLTKVLSDTRSELLVFLLTGLGRGETRPRTFIWARARKMATSLSDIGKDFTWKT